MVVIMMSRVVAVDVDDIVDDVRAVVKAVYALPLERWWRCG